MNSKRVGAVLAVGCGVAFAAGCGGGKPGKAAPAEGVEWGPSGVGEHAAGVPAVPAPAAGMDPRLVGTWVQEFRSTVRGVDDVFVFVTYHYLIIAADGRFEQKSESAGSHGGGTLGATDRTTGRVTADGRALAFASDDGRRWAVAYQHVGADGLRVNGGGELYIRR